MIPDSHTGSRRRRNPTLCGKPRAVIYVRQSQKNEESISLELQEEINRGYCKRQGYHVVDVIPDQISGRKWDKRKGVRKVMQMVEAGEADVVVLYRWSRISRRRLHQAQAIYLIEEAAGCRLESATEPFDTRTAAGKFGRDQMLSFAAFQGDLIGEQWTETHDRRRENGLPHCGGARFGYVYAEKRYGIDSDTRDHVAWMYDAYIKGAGFRSIANELNGRGIFNARGQLWREVTVTSYLDSGFAAGLIPHNVTNGFDNRSWLPGDHESILDEGVWDKYLVARRRRRAGALPPRFQNPRYPLSGLVRCGDCEGFMVSCKGSSGETGHSYQCGRWKATGKGRCVTITRARVERRVKGWLAKIVVDIEKAAERNKQIKTIRTRVKSDVETAARGLAVLDSQLTKLTLRYNADIIPEVAYIASRDELMAKRKIAQQTLDAAEAHADQIVPLPPRDIVVRLLDDWDILPVAERRAMLGRLISAVEVHPPDRPHTRGTVRILPVWETDQAVLLAEPAD